MFTVRIAEINIAIDNHYSFVERQCHAYLTQEKPDFCVSVTKDEIIEEYEKSTIEVKTKVTDLPGYCESGCLYRKICMILPKYGALLFHSAAVRYKEGAYLFSAPSGTGKTTHLLLWRKLHRNELTVINGDKPILRCDENGQFKVYGTPWAGKECWNNNISAPLRTVCFIERAKENSIERISSGEAAMRAMKQILYPQDPVQLTEMLRLTDKLLYACPFFLLHCNISDEAAELSFGTLTALEEQ